MNKEFRRDDDGCLNLQNSVTDDDKMDDQTKDDLSNSSEEKGFTSYRYGNYILEIPDDMIDDQDCDEQCTSDSNYCDDSLSTSDLMNVKSDIYQLRFPASAMLSSLVQMESSKNRAMKLSNIKKIVDSIESTQFDSSESTMSIVTETFKQLINFCRTYKFYLDDVVYLKTLLKDSDKIDRLQIQKRRKKAKKLLKSFLIDMSDTVSTLIFDTNLLSNKELRYDENSL